MPWFLFWERTGNIYWPLKISWGLGTRRSVESRRSNSLISKHDLACETKPDCLRGPPWFLKEQVYCHLQMCLSRHEEISFSCLSSNSNTLRLQNRRNGGNEIEQKDCTQKFKKDIFKKKREQGMDSSALNSFGFMQLKYILNSLENFLSLWL